MNNEEIIKLDTDELIQIFHKIDEFISKLDQEIKSLEGGLSE